jgi:hypothetical protein
VMATAKTPSLNASSLPVSFSPRVSCRSSIMLSPPRVASVSQVLAVSLLKFQASLFNARIPSHHQGYCMARHTRLSIALRRNEKVMRSYRKVISRLHSRTSFRSCTFPSIS